MNSGLKLWQKALKVIPGGNGLLSKRPERYAPDLWPTYYESAKGCEVVDLDGNKFIDHRIDKYLCFENLDKDFRFLCKDLMLPKIKLPQHKTKIKRLKIDYTCYYNDWMRDIVASKFSSYIQKFNYKFGC